MMEGTELPDQKKKKNIRTFRKKEICLYLEILEENRTKQGDRKEEIKREYFRKTKTYSKLN